MKLPAASPLAASLLAALALAAPAAAQCEVDRLGPGLPPASFGITGTVSGGVVVAVRGGDVTVFEPSTAGWSPSASFPPEGWSLFMAAVVASDGDTVFVGQPEDGNLTGRVYAHERAQGWARPTVLAAAQPATYDTFGAALAVHGDTLVVGAPMTLMDTICGPGKLFVFERVGDQWLQAAYFRPHGHTFTMGGFGTQIDTDGVTVVAGAGLDDELGVFAGAVYVYERAGREWTESAKLFPSDAAAEPRLGVSVAVDGDVLMAGSGAGRVYVFERQGGTWTETQVLTAPDGQPDDQFGTALDLDGDRVAIGAPFADAAQPNVGALYVFRRQGSIWTFESKTVAADADHDARFGLEVDLDGDVALWMGSNQPQARLLALEGGGVPFCPAGPSSTGDPARLQTDGCASLAGGITFRAEPLPTPTAVLFVYGPLAVETPLGNGTLCVGGAVTRSPVFSAAGSATWTPDFTQPPHDQVTPGSTWRFQAVFRDPAAGGSGVALSDGLIVTFQP